MFKKLLKKINCFLIGEHNDVAIFRARYFIAENCTRCGTNLHHYNTVEYWKREKEFFFAKYGWEWRQYC